MKLYEIIIILLMVGILIYALYKEIAFYNSEEHSFGKGNFVNAVANSNGDTIVEFPNKLIYWRRSVILAILITFIVFVVYSCNCASRIAWIFITFIVIAALIYFQFNYYSFHVYKHFANRFKELIVYKRI